ncbi:MAG TPA: hypothetical protein VK459_01085 [Polyangiaceae bacterium]|nr:hypothetical protein [Polyangiaceae bacterium]
MLEHDELFGDFERGLDGSPGFSMGSVLGDGLRDSTTHKLGAEPRLANAVSAPIDDDATHDKMRLAGLGFHKPHDVLSNAHCRLHG